MPGSLAGGFRHPPRGSDDVRSVYGVAGRGYLVAAGTTGAVRRDSWIDVVRVVACRAAGFVIGRGCPDLWLGVVVGSGAGPCPDRLVAATMGP